MYVLIRYSEIALKKRNRKRFEDILINNIKEVLRNNLVNVKRYPGRIVIEVKNFERAKTELHKIFGIKSFSPTIYYCFKDFEDLIDFSEEYFKNIVRNRRFKVECNRVGKHDFTSYDIKKVLGERLSKYGIVDIKNPEIITYLEIRENDAYLFTEIYEGPGGLPIGSEGKVLALVSGGFDSPVAAWLMMKRGCLVDILFANMLGEEQEKRVLQVIKKLLEWSSGYDNKIFIADFSEFLDRLKNEVEEKYWITVFKRFLYKVAENICLKIGAKGIVTGESLGQKASQTLDNLYAAEKGISIPIYRPLIGFDKDEIIKISRRIGLYEFSEKVPEQSRITGIGLNPKTRCKPEEIDIEFKKFEELVKKVKIKVLSKEDIL